MAFRCVKEMACWVEWYRIKVGVLLGLWSVRVNALCDLLSNVWTRSFKSGSDVSCWGEVVRVAMLGPSVMVLMVMVMVMVRVKLCLETVWVCTVYMCTKKKGCYVLL